MPCTIYLDTSILCALADPPARGAYARTCQTLARRWSESVMVAAAVGFGGGARQHGARFAA